MTAGEGTTLAVSSRERLLWAALASDLRFGPKSFQLLLARVPDIATAWDTPARAVGEWGLPREAAERFLAARQAADLDALEAAFDRHQVRVLTLMDPGYPSLLREIAVPPAVLFLRGELADRPALAVVGTRSMTPYGARVVGDIVPELARQGIAVVSGLALGVDGAAHRAALEGNGVTWAVLASGVDRPYPMTHRGLAEQILERGGALVSEFPLGTGALKHHFPIRNRIIAGLARATLVIEASDRSGTLLTARSALEANRDVLAVPGSIYSPHSRGPHALLGLGAKLVQSAADVLAELDLADAAQEQQAKAVLPDSAEEAAVLAVLGSEPLPLDDLTEAAGLDAATVLSTLTLMELKGRVRNLGNNAFVRR